VLKGFLWESVGLSRESLKIVIFKTFDFFNLEQIEILKRIKSKSTLASQLNRISKLFDWQVKSNIAAVYLPGGKK
jgi:hypothetical protein